MVAIHAISGRTLALGREGENLARQVVFDISEWRASYGDGTVSLIAQRHGDAEPYPCNITVDGDTVTWPITAADTAQAGYGRCELRYSVGDVLVKSEMWRTFVADALGTPQPEPPEPAKNWVDAVLKSSADAKQAATESAESAKQAAEASTNAANSANEAQKSREAIENMEVSAVSLPPDSNATVEKSLTDNRVKLTFGIPKGEQGESGTEQLIVTVKDDTSDKTPAEIAEAVNAGKQVILQDSSVDVVQSCYLVNVSNDVATFCGTEQITDGTADLDPIFSRCWYTILNDQTALHTYDFNIAPLTITKDANGKYTSVSSPEELLIAIDSGCAANALLMKDDGSMLSGTIYYDDTGMHIYFPDYAKNLIYDLKWNDDMEPSTYTFTELSIGGTGGAPLIVDITLDSSTHNLVADKTYKQIETAFLAGRSILCVDESMGFAINYCQYKAGDYFDFYIPWTSSSNTGETKRFYIIWLILRITTNNEVERLAGNLEIPEGIPWGAGTQRNKILKTNANGAMQYVDADTYLVKQATSSESGLFLSTDGYGGQEWANPLTAGNNDSVVIKSSTPNSTKKFRITVDDAGTISAAEI